MMTLRDGPAKGAYMVKRAPLYLRGVTSPQGESDVLDMLDDEARADEKVSVYRRVTDVGQVHLNFGGGKKTGRRTGFYVLAEYEWLPDVDGEQVREVALWREWCELQPLPAQP